MFNIKSYTYLKIILLNFLFLNKRNIFNFILKNHKESKSQIYQDLFVLYYTNNKKNGFFIEIGGGNGFDLSNTYLLEKKFSRRSLLLTNVSIISFGNNSKQNIFS